MSRQHWRAFDAVAESATSADYAGWFDLQMWGWARAATPAAGERGNRACGLAELPDGNPRNPRAQKWEN